MSRSYKKTPISKFCPKDASFEKRLANKRVRRDRSLYKRKAYKKLYNSWEIHDYVERYTKQDAKKYYKEIISEYSVKKDSFYLRSFLKKYPTEEVFLMEWDKGFRRK